jgi:hypothetical protein
MIPIRPLGKVRELVQSTGIDVTYAYDDLVFSEHSMFILRFDEKDVMKLYLHFNKDCNETEAAVMEKRLRIGGRIGGFEVERAGNYSIDQMEGKEELQIQFL